MREEEVDRGGREGNHEEGEGADRHGQTTRRGPGVQDGGFGRGFKVKMAGL